MFVGLPGEAGGKGSERPHCRLDDIPLTGGVRFLVSMACRGSFCASPLCNGLVEDGTDDAYEAPAGYWLGGIDLGLEEP